MTPEEREGFEAVVRLALETAIEEPPLLDENLRLTDLRQANLLIHELCSMLAMYGKHPLASVLYGDTLVQASDVLSAIAHFVACDKREQDVGVIGLSTTTEGDDTQWKPRLPLLG